MAGDFQKPNLVHTLFPEEIPEKMWPLPVKDLFFVGGASERKLHKLGIHTIGELARCDVEILKAHMKKHGEVIWEFANGRDAAVVEEEIPANKGYGNSTTVAFDVCDMNTARIVLLSLAETIGRRLRKDQVGAQVVSVGIRYFNLTYEAHQSVLTQPTDLAWEIYQAAERLFGELWDGTPIRHLGIHTGKIAAHSGERQLSLFDQTDYEKLEKLERAVDRIRQRFGADAVRRAVFLEGGKAHREGNMAIDHMSGGISRERRRIDYGKEKVI